MFVFVLLAGFLNDLNPWLIRAKESL
jgi:hypothetical protein